MTATISDQDISYTLTSKLNDTLAFTHANGQEFAVRVLPTVRPDGKLSLYEKWQRVPSSRAYRLLTERGFEIVFELPFLFEYHLEQEGYPQTPEELIQRFFEGMQGANFKSYPRELFK